MKLSITNVPVDLTWTAKVAVEGRLDANTSEYFEKTLESILVSVDFLILDLAKLSYISSAGLRALMMVNKTLAERDGRVFCTNLQPQIAQVMEAVKQLPGLNTFGSDEEMDAYLAKIQDDVLKKRKKRT